MKTFKNMNTIKTLKYFFIMSLVVISSGFTCYTQTTEKPKNPNYDAALAKKLGASEFGMKMYVLAILKKGPNYSTIQAKEHAWARSAIVAWLPHWLGNSRYRS